MTQATHFPSIGGNYVRDSRWLSEVHVWSTVRSAQLTAGTDHRPFFHMRMSCAGQWPDFGSQVSSLLTFWGLHFSTPWLACLSSLFQNYWFLVCLFVCFFLILKKSGPESRGMEGKKYFAFIFFSVAQQTGWQSPNCHQKASLFWGGHQIIN